MSTGIARWFDSGPERTERRTMGLLEALQKYIDAEEAKDPEIIDGTNIKDVLDVVDLSIAHSPVIPFRAPDHVSPAESLRGAVEAIETEGGGYILRDCPTMTHPVSADALKRMRARYLLTRGAVMRPRMDALFRRIAAQ